MKTKQFELTGKCNLRCEFCYNKDYLNKWNEMPEDYVLENAGKNNFIFIGGGEPMFYNGIESLIENLLKNENIVVISTNGSIYKELPKSNNLQIQVGLPAIDKEIYSEITGKDLIENVKYNTLKYKENFNIFINFPVYAKNICQLEKVAQFCKENDLVLRVRPAIPVNRIETVDEKIIKKKCLNLALSYGVDIRFSYGRNGNIEYFTPKGKIRYPFTK